MTFKYTGPGYYVTRDGRKALVGEYKSGGLVGLLYARNERMPGRSLAKNLTWQDDGRCIYNPDCVDLVGPWVDPPKPLELWAIIGDSGEYLCAVETEHAAKRATTQVGTYIHMREVTDESV